MALVLPLFWRARTKSEKSPFRPRHNTGSSEPSAWARVSPEAILAMFQISRLEDANVKILPENLGKPRLEAITQEIESLYIDKVIKDLGLVITLYEIVSIEGGTVYPGEGSAHFKVEFRVVVFRPFVGEIIEGTLKKADKTGLYVDIGFLATSSSPSTLCRSPRCSMRTSNCGCGCTRTRRCSWT